MTTAQAPSKTMNIILWIAQLVLAAGFIWAASMKLFERAEVLAAMWPWTAGNYELAKLTGVADLLAGLGLVLPALFRILPKLTVYAASGAILLMIVAAGWFHCLGKIEKAPIRSEGK